MSSTRDVDTDGDSDSDINDLLTVCYIFIDI